MDVIRKGGFGTILASAGIYLTCCYAMIAMVMFASPFKTSSKVYFAVAVYFALGVVMSRLVMRRLVAWHPMLATMHSKSMGKLLYALFWPYAYPILLVRAFIDWVL